MGTARRQNQAEFARAYDREGVLGQIIERPVPFSLNADLRESILTGKRVRNMENISIKLDPAHIAALRKIATMKAIPYQTLIRLWLAEGIRRELRVG